MQIRIFKHFFHHRKNDFLMSNVALVMYSNNRLKQPNAVKLQTLSTSTAFKDSVESNGEP